MSQRDQEQYRQEARRRYGLEDPPAEAYERLGWEAWQAGDFGGALGYFTLAEEHCPAEMRRTYAALCRRVRRLQELVRSERTDSRRPNG